MGTYYGLEIVQGTDRQIFFCEKGLPPSEFLTVFRSCDRASPEFPSGFEDSDEPYIPSHAYFVPVPLLIERLEVMGFTLAALQRDVKACVKNDIEELDRQIEEYELEQAYYDVSPDENEPEEPVGGDDVSTPVISEMPERRPVKGTSVSSYHRDLKRRQWFLGKFTLERWVRTMRVLRGRGILQRHDLRKDYRGLTRLERHILNVGLCARIRRGAELTRFRPQGRFGYTAQFERYGLDEDFGVAGVSGLA